MSRIDEEFEALADQVSQAASQVRCPVEDYQAGLRSIIERLKVDLRASEEMDS